MSELKTIRLYGAMGTRFGRVHRFAVSSTAEAVQALCSQVPGFERYLTESKSKGFNFAVFHDKRNIGESELNMPTGGSEIRIAPVPSGSKRNGVLQTIVGIVLVVVGVMTSWAGGTMLVATGVGMIAGGIVQMLTPMPKSGAKDSGENESSYSFNGPVNTQAQGNPVPLCYGRMIVGSAVVSASIKTRDRQIAGAPNLGAWGAIIGGGRFNDLENFINEQVQQ